MRVAQIRNVVPIKQKQWLISYRENKVNTRAATDENFENTFSIRKLLNPYSIYSK